MIRIEDKRDCTGCGACVNVCPIQIIVMEEDKDGFVYPQVRKDQCIDCHLCEKICPMLTDESRIKNSSSKYPLFYAGQLKKKEDLFEVSSGGAFWAFSQAILELGGVVYGAVQEDVDTVYHFRADSFNAVKKLRRSKYFQSDTRLTFQQVKEDLKKGTFVLYSGTGCQIAGLKSYLSKEYSNLITCEVVCHGVPSRRVWKTYRKEKEESEKKIISDLVFRDKSAGWSHNQYKITYSDGSVEKQASTQQLFHAGYLEGLFYRPSCGCCRFASLPRIADVTLADYWRYKGRFTQQGTDLGVSLIAINNENGSKILRLSSRYLDYDTTEKRLALDSCKHMDEHPSENPNRGNFLALFNEVGYYVAANKYITNEVKTSLIKRIARKLKSLYYKNIIAIQNKLIDGTQRSYNIL